MFIKLVTSISKYTPNYKSNWQHIPEISGVSNFNAGPTFKCNLHGLENWNRLKISFKLNCQAISKWVFPRHASKLSYVTYILPVS